MRRHSTASTGQATGETVRADHWPAHHRHSRREQGAQARRRTGRFTKIVAKDPITIQGNAYVSIVGQAAIDNMKHAVDLFHAENDRYPKDYDEFMTVIVKPHGIALPQLPPYQKYAYDEKEHKLIIMEYPDLKN